MCKALYGKNAKQQNALTMNQKLSISILIKAVGIFFPAASFYTASAVCF